MAQMCAKLVRRRGHLAVIAATSQEALTILRDASDVDVVLSDIQMPSMSGIELLLQLRRMDPHLPIILMTGYANVVSATEALALGAADFLSKPFNASTLIGSLERAFETRRAIMA